MGEGMVKRLLEENIAGTSAEQPLIIWNRSKEKCTNIVEKYGTKSIVVKDTAREVVEACAVTYSMLSTPDASKAVFGDGGDGDDGVLAGISAGKSIVDCATLAESDMERMNQAVTAKGGYVLRYYYYYYFVYFFARFRQ